MGVSAAHGQPIPPDPPAAASAATASPPAAAGVETNPRIAAFDLAVDAQATFKTRIASFWRENGVDYALLEGDVRFTIEDYGFRAARALVRVDRLPHPEDPNAIVRHLTLYLDQARTEKQLMVTADADRLLVTAATTGAVFIDSDLPQAVRGAPAGGPSGAFIADGFDRMRLHFSPLATQPEQTLAGGVDRPGQLRQHDTPALQGGPSNRLGSAEVIAPDGVESPLGSPPVSPLDPETVLPLTGTVLWDADRYEAVLSPADGQDATLTLSGSVRLIYQDALSPRVVTLEAQSCVVFMKPLGGNRTQPLTQPRTPPAVPGSTFEASQIRGIYLEGGVIIRDGDYTVRSPRGYYDLLRDKAVLLEAVVYTFDQKRRIPIYVRAEVIRQLARTTFEAEHALLSTSAFAVPHFAVGARKLTVSQRQQPATAYEDGPAAGGVATLRGGFNPGASGASASGASASGAPTSGATISDTAPAARIPGASPTGRGPSALSGQDQETVYDFTAESATVQWGRLPVFWWPKVTGDSRDIPLKRIQVGSQSRIGTVIETEWDLNALLGQDRTPGVESRLKLDSQGDHGLALGATVQYNRQNFRGEFDGYLVPQDNDTDDLGGRSDVDQNEGEARGFYKFQHEHRLGQNTQLQLRSDYASDETVLEVFRQEEARSAQAYETSAFLIRQQDDWSVSLLARADTNDFIPQLTTLQAPGFTVERLPEASFQQIGTPLFDGRLTYFTENTASYLRARLPDDTPGDRGFSNAAANELFGIDNTDPFSQRFDVDADGTADFDDGLTLRGDSRHEIAAPLRFADVDVTPYAVGRLTAYSDDNLAPGADNARLWGQIGVRASTSFQSSTARVYNPVLDLNGLRHIIEPSANAFYTESSADSSDLLPFDASIEGINDEPGVRLGVRNTWQTQRGGHGLWRSVDWIVWDTDLVLSDDDSANTTGIARWFGFRPELARGGDHFYTDVRWLITDVFTASGDLTYLLDQPDVDGLPGTGSRLAQWRIGGFLNPDRAVQFFGNYQVIDALDSELFTYGANIAFTDKYTLMFNQRLDLSERESRTFSVGLIRKLPQWELGIGLSRDELNEETRFRINLAPAGFGGGGLNFNSNQNR